MTNEKGLHPRNIHRQGYDFQALLKESPDLASYIKANPHDGSPTIDYADPDAVLVLNQALLSFHYKVKNWSIPKGHLCPTVPGRADYLHYISDLLSENNSAKPPVGPNIKGLDIGTGTSCIYPLLGNSIYGWKFVGVDINPDAINNVKNILNANPTFKKNIKTRFQKNSDHIFKDLLQADEKFDFTMCNPPFYSSKDEASNASSRKIFNLNINKKKKGLETVKSASNFGGIDAELWCEGGEKDFIKKMITESFDIKHQCIWFTTLVSNSDNLNEFSLILESFKCKEVRIIKMHQGKKIAHILAWSF